jgi:hypothetical protein
MPPKRRASPKSKSKGNGGSRRSQQRRAPAKTGQGSNGKPRNQTAEGTVPEREYQDYTMLHPGSISDSDEPDVLLDVPIVNVDEIHFELENLQARVSVHAEVLDIVSLSVGVHAELGKVELDIKGVEAQALFRARLDHVTAIIDRVLTTFDRNPALLESVGRSIEQIGTGAGRGVGQIGEGAGHAVEDVGEGAGQAVEDVGGGAGQAVGDVGKGVGQGAGGALSGLGQGVGQLPQLAAGGGSGASGGNGGGAEMSPGRVAKEVAKRVAKELGSAASDEAKDLGLAATHKAAELGERRRKRRAMKHHATEAALREAETAGVDVEEIDGSGADGRVTVKDVRAAAS